MQVDSQTGDEQFQALAKYAVDLTAKASVLDPVSCLQHNCCYINACVTLTWLAGLPLGVQLLGCSPGHMTCTMWGPGV
jgi:hypothetical protein